MRFRSVSQSRYKYTYHFRAVHWYAVTFAKPIYNSTDSVNPLKSLLYAAHHHYTLSSYLGLVSMNVLSYVLIS